MVQAVKCMFDPTLLMSLPNIGQNTAYPYWPEILAPTAVLVADGGDRIMRSGDLHCGSPAGLVCLLLAASATSRQ